MMPIDWAVLPVYLIGITLLGAWTARRVKTSSDFFMPRRFGKAMMITFAFGTGTSSDQAVTVASKTLTNGLSAIWWQWIWLPATPFYWVIAPIMRRLRAVTTADVYELRYDRSVALLYCVFGVVGMAVKIGLLLKGAGAMVDSCTGGVVDASYAIVVVTVLFLVYGMAGGLGAAVVTDFVQGLMTIAFSFALLPFVLQATGGLEGVRATLTEYNPAMLSLVAPGKIDTFFVVMYSIQALVGIVAQPFIMGVCGAGRTEMDGRVGFMIGNIVKRICTMAWSVTSLAAVAWYLNSGIDLSTIDPDYLYGHVAREFLPMMLPGLLGVFLSCLLASIMSSCDAIMISASALFTENFYRHLQPNRTDKHYLAVGRIASIGIVAGGVAFAYSVEGVVEALNVWFRIAPMVAIAFWVGLFWRRATAAGAWAGTLAAVAAWALTNVESFVGWLAQHEWITGGGVVKEQADGLVFSDPWVVVFYLASGILACILVSLWTQPVPETKLRRFYDLIYTPVRPGEVVTQPCQLPEGTPPAERTMLVDWQGLQIPRPSLTSVLGVVCGWVMVAGLVGGFVWLINR
ncbi:sodium:solute symporter family protein [Aeoliella sp. ICT_H6.2]|uniref:Sodium:solute symporter family protein n=1 Tax=Aeoliella straminimaris TaxID=2954799 RepID=A0A9X2JIZ3_9BACT|nr:sodium:solute symporter family protein [Aeoliella straminimaris]MCO6046228.1 sodium:solute symporter family protein [Aeoliella straminimaris]